MTDDRSDVAAEYGIKLSEVEQRMVEEGKRLGWFRRKLVGLACIVVSVSIIAFICYLLEVFKESAKERAAFDEQIAGDAAPGNR